MSMDNMKDNEKDNIEENIVIEEAFVRLENITAQLENPDTGLKDSLLLYSEGVKLAAACRANLEGVEKEIQILDEI